MNQFFFLSFLLLPCWFQAQIQLSIQHKKEAQRLFKISEYDSSAYHYEKAISFCKSCPDTLKARLNLSLFKTYKHAERHEEAYFQLVKAENHVRKVKSDEFLTLIYVAFAEYFRSTRKYDKADIYLDKAFQVISKGKVSDAALAQYYNRKAAILSEGHLDNKGSIEFSLKSIEIARKLNDQDLEAISLNEIGFAYEKMDPLKSIAYYKRAIGIWEKMDDGISLANALGNLVRVYIKTDQYELALKHNTQGYELAEKNKLSYWFAVFTFQQYEIYRHQNKLTLALKTLEEYVSLNVDYTNKQYLKAIAKAENEYEAKQKDNQLKLNELELKTRALALEKNKQDQMYLILAILFVSGLLFLILLYSVRTKQTNKKLQSLLNENQFLIGESNHRIKNNLQLIIALIYQEMEKQKVDFEKSNLFEIVEKIEAVSSLHKQLYTNDSKQMIRIDTYLNDIKENFDTFFQKRGIKVDFDIENMEVTINKSLYLGILTTELILNSLKHAFNEQKKERWIFLSLKMENGKVQFQYRDSGPGLKSSDIHLKLVHLMSQQMRFNYKIRQTDHFFFDTDLTGKL